MVAKYHACELQIKSETCSLKKGQKKNQFLKKGQGLCYVAQSDLDLSICRSTKLVHLINDVMQIRSDKVVKYPPCFSKIPVSQRTNFAGVSDVLILRMERNVTAV